MNSRRVGETSTAAEWLEKYAEAARRADGSTVSTNLLEVQARRATEITDRLAAGEALVLPDPVGTGKTAVALIAAAMLFEAKMVRRIVIITPNEAVRKLWETRATWARSPRTGRPPAKSTFNILTRKQLSSQRRPSKPEGVLVIIDEAHRGLQHEGDFQQTLEEWASGCPVLLVTATPFQLSSQGLMTMLGIGRTGSDRDKAKVEAYGSAVARLARELRQASERSASDPSQHPAVAAALAEANRLSPDAMSVVHRRIMEPDSDLLRLRGKPPDLHSDLVKVADEWLETYHVARLIPEFLGVGKGDMFNRRLLSCSEAFWKGTAGRALRERAEKSKRIRALADELEHRLGGGCEHPKVEATADWVAQRIRKGRHVLVFCVFVETQKALAEAITNKLSRSGQASVAWPTGAALPRNVVAQFRSSTVAPLALVVQDRFSESIDLDGGSPCLVHHDLPWTPARVTQRWGRVVRASSKFSPVKTEDIYVPVLDLASDRRLFKTVRTRAAIGDLLLPREVLTDGIDADAYALPDDILDQLRPASSR